MSDYQPNQAVAGNDIGIILAAEESFAQKRLNIL